MTAERAAPEMVDTEVGRIAIRAAYNSLKGRHIAAMDYIAELEKDKRDLCEVIASLVLQQGGTIIVTPDTLARVNPSLWIHISQAQDGQRTYMVGETGKRSDEQRGPVIQKEVEPVVALHTHTWILRGGRDVCFTCGQPRPTN